MVFWGVEVKPGAPFIHKIFSAGCEADPRVCGGCCAGVEVKPGKPYTHYASGDEHMIVEGSTLHLSQATLGLEGKSKDRVVVKCQVGDGPELLLCSLILGVSESCSLDLLFDQDVTFSVVGSTSVHLIGYYMPLEDDEMEDSDYDLPSEDDEDSEDEDDEDDMLMDDEAELVPSSVRIEEIDDEAPAGKLLKGTEGGPTPEGKNAQKKRKKAEAQAAKVKAEQEAKQVESPAKPAAASGDDSEDEDGFPKETPNKKQAVEGLDGAATPAAPDSGKKRKKNKKKNKKEEQTPGSASPAVTTTAASTVTSPSEPAKASEKQGKKAKAKENGLEKSPATNGTTHAADNKSAKKETSAVKKFPNGLEIQEVSMGKPDAKQAQAGKRVGMIYTGRLKSNGKVFDSNVGRKPFEFRLGVGEVIKGWDVGVSGMRVGDKRKLVIPPAMAYGAKGVSGSIPGNATLEFDVELVNVK